MISIVFPLFFGLIVGDVGYGLIFLAMSLGLRKFLKGEAGEQLLTVLQERQHLDDLLWYHLQ